MIKKKNKFVFFSLVAVLGLLGMAGMVSAGRDMPVKTVHIITPEWKGQTNRDGTGLFFEILRAVYTPSGIHMEFQLAPWKRCRAMVSAGRTDAMLCVWKADAEKHNQLIPRYPVYVEQTAVVFKKASLISWQGIHTLDYTRAVWLRGYDYNAAEFMQDIQLAFWHEVDSYDEAWQQLNRDRFDVYIDALIDLNFYIRENKIDMDLYQKEVLWSTNAYVAFTNTDRSRQLISIFDREIVNLFKSGQLAMIYRNWNQPFLPDNWRD